MKYKNEYVLINGKSGRQVNKPMARSLFNQGRTIFVHPCNMILNNMWQRPFEISDKLDHNFDKLVNSYEYYNCNNELGRYANFFVCVSN